MGEVESHGFRLGLSWVLVVWGGVWLGFDVGVGFMFGIRDGVSVGSGFGFGVRVRVAERFGVMFWCRVGVRLGLW